MCLYPRIVKNPKYKSTKKNGGIIPPVYDARTLYVPIGCNNCIECRKQKAREWQIRLMEDIKEHTNGKFITLTFSNESIIKLSRNIKLKGYDLDNAIATKAVRKFTERWRAKHKRTIRHWLVTELGHQGTENIHIHGIVWTDKTFEEIEAKWQYGWIYPNKQKQERRNYVNGATVNYIIKYVSKRDIQHKHYKNIILCSKGIGSNYLKGWDWKNNKYNGKNTNETYKTSTGHKMSMPIYWRNKIYSDEEKEKLWINKLDKEERWVCGEKIKINKTYESYWNTIAYYRRINRKLGYGELEIKNEEYWNRKEYEESIRIIRQETRKKNT